MSELCPSSLSSRARGWWARAVPRRGVCLAFTSGTADTYGLRNKSPMARDIARIPIARQQPDSTRRIPRKSAGERGERKEGRATARADVRHEPAKRLDPPPLCRNLSRHTQAASSPARSPSCRPPRAQPWPSSISAQSRLRARNLRLMVVRDWHRRPPSAEHAPRVADVGHGEHLWRGADVSARGWTTGGGGGGGVAEKERVGGGEVAVGSTRATTAVVPSERPSRSARARKSRSTCGRGWGTGAGAGC